MIDGKIHPSLSPAVPTQGGMDESDSSSGSLGRIGGGGSMMGSGGPPMGSGGLGSAQGAMMSMGVSRGPGPPPMHPQSQHGESSARKPVRLCQVCGDIAKSLHFGGLSCDSCKAFFRRSVQNDAYKHFRCGGDQKCSISIASRKFCKYCRFAKCEAIGMTKSWVVSEDERLQLMKTRLTGRMMYQHGASSTGSATSISPYPPGGPREAAPYPTMNSSMKGSQHHYRHSPPPNYQPPTHSMDLGSSGSSPNSSPPTPCSGPLTPIRYGPIPPTSFPNSHSGYIPQGSPKELSPIHGRGVVDIKEEVEMKVEEVFNPASQYLSNQEMESLSHVISNIKLVDQLLPYPKDIQPQDVMGTYKRFAERLTRFLRTFDDFKALSPMAQGNAIKKNITLIAFVFASSFVNEKDGSYNNIHSPNRPMITNLDMIQRAMSPEVFQKFKDILGTMRAFQVDSRMAYILVLIIVFGTEGLDSGKDHYKQILRQYIAWKTGECTGSKVYEGLISTLEGLRKHSEMFESMSVKYRQMESTKSNFSVQQYMSMMDNRQSVQQTMLMAAADNKDLKARMENMSGEQLRQMLHGMDIEQMKQMLQGSGLEQMKQMLQSMDMDPNQMSHSGSSQNSPHIPPSHCQSPPGMSHSPQSMVQSSHMSQSPHRMMHSPHMLHSPQNMMTPPRMLASPHSNHGPLHSPPMPPTHVLHSMMEGNQHNIRHSPTASHQQLRTSPNNIHSAAAHHYSRDIKPPVPYLNSPQPLDLVQSPGDMHSPSRSLSLVTSPTPYMHDSYMSNSRDAERFSSQASSPSGGEVDYLAPTNYSHTPYSPAPHPDQYTPTYQTLYSSPSNHYKEERRPIPLTPPGPGHRSDSNSDSSMNCYTDSAHGNSMGPYP